LLLKCPPPPNSEAWRDGAATGKGFSVAKSNFYPEISGFFEAVGILFLFLKVNRGILGGFFEKGKFEI
jgi:hypothetical protein